MSTEPRPWVVDGPEEQELRRPDFVPGIPVRLLDGQEWHFAEPRVRFIPAAGDDGFEVVLSLGDDGTFNDLIERYRVLALMPPGEFAPHAVERPAIETKLAAMMINRNYDVDPKYLRQILQISYNPEDAEAFELRNTIARIILGDSPKPSAAGEGPSPTQAAC